MASTGDSDVHVGRACACGASLGRRNRSGRCASCHRGAPFAEKASAGPDDYWQARAEKLHQELLQLEHDHARLQAVHQHDQACAKRDLQELRRQLQAAHAQLDGQRDAFEGDPIPF